PRARLGRRPAAQDVGRDRAALRHGIRSRGHARRAPPRLVVLMRVSLRVAIAGLAVAILLAVTPRPVAAQRFLPDDPVPRDDDTVDAPRPHGLELSTVYDVVARSFTGRPSARSSRAANVHTLGEVPGSSWFTNRMGARVLDLPELVRGPDGPVGPD